jgi:hypothetical protein
VNGRLAKRLTGLLWEPGLSCPNCHHHYAQTRGRMKPLCMRPQGCPYGDVAPDWALTRKAEAFVQAELLNDTPGYAALQQRLLKESGLEDEGVETILHLRGILSDYRDDLAKQKGGGGKR